MGTPFVVIRAYNLGLKAVPNFVGTLTEEQIAYYEAHLDELADAIRRGFVIPSKPEVQASTPEKTSQRQPPVLTGTGPTFGEWLVAREQIHLFLTSERISLSEMFVVTPELLVRTDIMPVFRPTGATNRMALDWKVQLGMNDSHEEGRIMDFEGSAGSKVPELYYINRSVRPDEDTLGNNAKSSNAFVTSKKSGLSLYGWSDADNLHFLITGIHLDSGDTWSLSPNDWHRGDGGVGACRWDMRRDQAVFSCHGPNGVSPYIGARVATPVSLRPKS